MGPMAKKPQMAGRGLNEPLAPGYGHIRPQPVVDELQVERHPAQTEEGENTSYVPRMQASCMRSEAPPICIPLVQSL